MFILFTFYFLFFWWTFPLTFTPLAELDHPWFIFFPPSEAPFSATSGLFLFFLVKGQRSFFKRRSVVTLCPVSIAGPAMDQVLILWTSTPLPPPLLIMHTIRVRERERVGGVKNKLHFDKSKRASFSSKKLNRNFSSCACQRPPLSPYHPPWLLLLLSAWRHFVFLLNPLPHPPPDSALFHQIFLHILQKKNKKKY